VVLGQGGARCILIPVKQPPGAGELDANTRTRDAIQRSLRCQHITASPSKIGDIAPAALVLTHFEYGYIT
jgi:hypothetical protein